MKPDLQSLKNIGPKMEEHLRVIGVYSVEEFLNTGSYDVAKKLFLSGEVKPHPMYYHALVAAERDREIFSFDRAEKAELKELYAEIITEIGG